MFYRLRYVDTNNIKPDIDLLVNAKNKKEAEEAGYYEIVKLAMKDLALLTCNATRMSRKNVMRISPEYFNHMVHGCWSLVECESQIQVSKHETKRSVDDIKAAANKKRKANGSKRRWSAAEKAARAAEKGFKVA